MFKVTKVPKLAPKSYNVLSGFKEECRRRNLSNALILKFDDCHKSNSKNILNVMLGFIRDEAIHVIEKLGFCLVYGILGTSPDGVSEDFVVKKKRPASEKAVDIYIKDDTTAEKI